MSLSGASFAKMLENRSIWIVLFLAALTRLALIIFAQVDGGDTPVYKVFAENILSGCGLSHSDPNSNQCVLTSGGYFPGYPAFIAIIWMVFGKSNQAILLVQLVCYVMALYWLLIAVMRLTLSDRAVLFTGLVFALSPLQMGWFRYVLTEPLAIATSIWFLAELIISVADRKFRAVHLALALCVSVYIKPYTILMAISVPFVLYYIYGVKNAVMHAFVFMLLTAIPVSVWLARNIAIGHAPLSMVSEATPKAPGYFFWLNTWVVNEYERADANFPVWRAEYSKIILHHSKYVKDAERETAQLLIQELSAMDGKLFPKEIDMQFSKLASLKIKNQNYLVPYAIYVERVAWLLFNPFSSWGLPLEMKSINKSSLKDAIVEFDLNRSMSLLNGYKLIIAGKIIIFIYRLIIFIGFTFIVCHVFFGRDTTRMIFFSPGVKGLIAGAASFVVAEHIFFGYLGGLESRYLVQVIPWVEFWVLFWLAGYDRCSNRIRS